MRIGTLAPCLALLACSVSAAPAAAAEPEVFETITGTCGPSPTTLEGSPQSERHSPVAMRFSTDASGGMWQVPGGIQENRFAGPDTMWQVRSSIEEGERPAVSVTCDEVASFTLALADVPAGLPVTYSGSTTYAGEDQSSYFPQVTYGSVLSWRHPGQSHYGIDLSLLGGDYLMYDGDYPNGIVRATSSGSYDLGHPKLGSTPRYRVLNDDPSTQMHWTVTLRSRPLNFADASVDPAALYPLDGDTAQVHLGSRGTGTATVRVLDEGSAVRTLMEDRPIDAFHGTGADFDGRDDQGELLPPGEYTVRFTLDDLWGNQSVKERPVTIRDQPLSVELINPRIGPNLLRRGHELRIRSRVAGKARATVTIHRQSGERVLVLVKDRHIGPRHPLWTTFDGRDANGRRLPTGGHFFARIKAEHRGQEPATAGRGFTMAR